MRARAPSTRIGPEMPDSCSARDDADDEEDDADDGEGADNGDEDDDDDDDDDDWDDQGERPATRVALSPGLIGQICFENCSPSFSSSSKGAGMR